MRGPTFYAFKDVADDAQRDYNDAVRFKEPQWKIDDARQALRKANNDLERAERTGE